MVYLEYKGQAGWILAGQYPSDKIAWLALGDDNLNYRTKDESGNVIKSTEVESIALENDGK